MSKKNRERREEREQPDSGSTGGGRSGGGIEWVSTIVAVAAIAFSFYVWTEARNLKKTTNSELATLQDRVANLAKQVAAAPRPAQAQQAPDPNKVYAINLDGAPSHGKPDALVTIAEFSDYQ